MTSLTTDTNNISPLYIMNPAALSPAKAPPASLFGSSAHTSHTSFPIIAVAVIGILATAILLVSYYIFVIKCCLNWHRIDLLRRFSFSRRRAAGENPLAAAYSPPLENRGLNEAAIRSIPIFKFGTETSDDDAKSQSRDCAVCLNEFQQGEKLRAIPNCSHVFHIDCIDIWLQNNANCPLCRTSISAARPETLLPMMMDRVLLGPGPAGADRFTGRDEDYVVIEIGSEPRNPSLLGIHEGGAASSNELLPSPRRKCLDSSSSAKSSMKKMKKLSNVSSMGDECIDSRRKDEQFVVQPMRRSFSMDSAADSQLYLAVQEIIQRHGHVNNELNQNEGSSSRVKKSFFSFGQGRCSRSAVQPVALEPRG